ncbi:MAG TPA: flagellar basal body rod protein FlgC [Bryobacteraceae bacterium]|jgi:flagellar basal-body rod protein FlgC|nr:flagellar basal body rod protein FlgC [Bryobacteraceae bacterium]
MSLFSAISISASGMEAQRSRAEIITENLANADTTRTPEGGPYKRKDAVFTTAPVPVSFSDALSAASGLGSAGQSDGVAVSDITIDDREPERRYLPGHPDADAQGYVAFPRVDPAEEMVDLMSASRSYQANVAAISAVKDMIARSIDLFR